MPRTRKDHQIISYLNLRLLIGACGILLPLICMSYGLLFEMQDSISDYYYTPVRDVFVGILFVMGFFLLSYRGYEPIDDWFANAGFFFALGVALFPCDSQHTMIQVTHFGSAFLLFCVFIFFSLKLFTKSIEHERTTAKDARNSWYKWCGWIMIISIGGIGLSYLLATKEFREHTNLTFWLESIALVAFAVSWLTKGLFYQRTLRLFVSVRALVGR